eukprot:TRINITY_DN19784_c0_g1_i1.p1 TRINITY_DN19784_c0_g1~~TRINITY_DN19784_c0_g1_i1.p1  ORF type:complete len:533 (+),score=124.36 TRINITY_DN19784_c0_g1_i1:79-1599(+)
MTYIVLLIEYFLVLGGYLLVGGGILQGLEKQHELDTIRKEGQTLKEANLTQQQIDILRNGQICVFRTEKDAEWTFAGATFFSLTVVTTIGYGHFTPRTTQGRAFTLLYSILGIGLVAHILKKMARAFLKIISRIWRKVSGEEKTMSKSGQLSQGIKERAFLTFDRFDADGSGTIDIEELGTFLEALSGAKVDPLVVNYVMNEADTDPDRVLTKEEMVQAVTVFYNLQSELPKTIVWRNIISGCVAMFIWLFSWAGAFGIQEGWDYREGFWYCYVTLTTIGFGDYHPKTHLGRLMAFLFIIPGLSLVGWFINAVFAASQAKRYWFMQHAYANGKLSERVLRSQGIRPLAKPPVGDGSSEEIHNIQVFKASPLKSLTLTPPSEYALVEPEVPESVISPPLTPNGTSINSTRMSRAGSPPINAPRRMRPPSVNMTGHPTPRGRGRYNPHGTSLQPIDHFPDTSSTLSDASYLKSPSSTNWAYTHPQHSQTLYTPLARANQGFTSDTIVT